LFGLVGLNLLFLVFVGLGFRYLHRPQQQESFPLATPTPTLLPCASFANQEYGFSVCYPGDWLKPEEEVSIVRYIVKNWKDKSERAQ